MSPDEHYMFSNDVVVVALIPGPRFHIPELDDVLRFH